MRMCFWAAVLWAAAWGLAGCQGDRKAEGAVRIAVIPKGTTHVFWQSVLAGAQAAGQDEGVEVLWIGPEKEDDRQQQIALVDNQVVGGVDGIVLAPLDAKALRRPVKAAVERGVPVVIFDSDLEDSAGLVTSFVATDNREGGRIAGRELAEMLGGQGKIAMLRYQEGSASTENRERGFLEAVAKYPGIEVVSEEQYGGATTAQCQQAAENLLLRFKDADGSIGLDGVFSSNESTTFGMLQAMRRNQAGGKVRFVGFDTSPPLVAALESGEIQGLVAQNPYKMGYLGVRTMARHLRGEPVPPVIDTGVTFVTPENLETDEVQALLRAPEQGAKD